MGPGALRVITGSQPSTITFPGRNEETCCLAIKDVLLSFPLVWTRRGLAFKSSPRSSLDPMPRRGRQRPARLLGAFLLGYHGPQGLPSKDLPSSSGVF